MQVTARAAVYIGADNGTLTDRAVADAVMAGVAGMPDGVPLDVHILGDVRRISPFAFGPVADFLIRASSITVHGPGHAVADIAAAITTAVEQEQRRLARTVDPDPVLAAQYEAMARNEADGGAA